MPKIRSVFNHVSARERLLKLTAEALIFGVLGCSGIASPQSRPPDPNQNGATAAAVTYNGRKPVLKNPAVPHVLGADLHSVSPWQNDVAYPEKSYADKWFGMMGRHQMFLADPTNRQIVNGWFSQFDSLRTKTTEEKAIAVEKAVNAYISYRSDKDGYQLDDYLATPLETIVGKHGDCEDYAILKYYALRYLDVPAENMFMVFVPQSGPEGHAILLVNTSRPGEKPDYLNLDNHTDTSLIRESKLPYKAFYLMNETGYWVADNSPYMTEPHKTVPEFPSP
jgi:predicted transglutaminase-like cysteine proteinase